MREAGATVADSYQVSIVNFKTEFDTTAVGNIFTVDDDHGKAYLSPQSIDLNWLSDNVLQISYDKNLRTFIRENAIGTTNIIYKLK